MNTNEANELDREYRSLNPLAVITVISCIFVPLALLAKPFWIAPIATVLLGVVALGSLAADPQKIGRKGVLIALGFALLVGCWATSRHLSRRQWLYETGREHADTWLELVHEGRLYEAHQLHLRKYQRVAKDVSLEEYYSKRPATDNAFDNFFDSPEMKAVRGITSRGEMVFDRGVYYEHKRHRDTVDLQYLLKFEYKGRKEEVPVTLVMVRELDDETGDRVWCVDLVRAKISEDASNLRAITTGLAPTS